MKRLIAIFTIISFCLSCISPAFAATRKLPPADFDDMYRVAANGDLGSLMAAASRGLDLDAVNQYGDAGICVAIKRGDYKAYNTFLKAGAHHHPRCVNFISKAEYEDFMASANAIKYSDYPTSFKPRSNYDWLIVTGIAAVGAGLVWLVKNATQ